MYIETSLHTTTGDQITGKARVGTAPLTEPYVVLTVEVLNVGAVTFYLRAVDQAAAIATAALDAASHLTRAIHGPAVPADR